MDQAGAHQRNGIAPHAHTITACAEQPDKHGVNWSFGGQRDGDVLKREFKQEEVFREQWKV